MRVYKSNEYTSKESWLVAISLAVAVMSVVTLVLAAMWVGCT